MQRQTKKELKEIKAAVEKVLEKYPKARDNDNLLYYLICREFAKTDDMDIDKMPFKIVLCGGWHWLPRFESIVRLRRMVQRKLPHLKPQKPITKGRAKKEMDFREFARKKGAI